MSRPPHFRRENDPIVRALHATAVCYSRIFHRVTVLRRCRLPARGPAILAVNHTSSLDPLLVQGVCPRVIRWMMANEYMDVWPLSYIFRTVGIIPVERTGRDLAATRAAMRALSEGCIIGVFPEGKIELTNELTPFQDGIGLLALRTQATIYPVYLDGTQRGSNMIRPYLLPNEATVSFGSPITFSDLPSSRDGVQQATGRVSSAIAALRAEHVQKPRKWGSQA